MANCTFTRPAAKSAKPSTKKPSAEAATQPFCPHPLRITIGEQELINAAHNASSSPAQILAFIKDRYKPLNYTIHDREPLCVSINYELK